MQRGIFIAGNESALTNAIRIEAGRRVGHYALALIPDRLSNGNERTGSVPQRENTSDSAAMSLEWNPGSPISARTLIIAAENRLGRIDEAILVCDPPSARYSAVDLNMANIEVLVNDHIKSWFFAVKELATVFKTRGSGTLALVYPEPGPTGSKDDAVDLLGTTALAAFRSLCAGLLNAAYNEPYCTLGFSCAETGDEAGFAAFIFKQLEEANRRSNGKHHKYGKLGFFR